MKAVKPLKAALLVMISLGLVGCFDYVISVDPPEGPVGSTIHVEATNRSFLTSSCLMIFENVQTGRHIQVSASNCIDDQSADYAIPGNLPDLSETSNTYLLRIEALKSARDRVTFNVLFPLPLVKDGVANAHIVVPYMKNTYNESPCEVDEAGPFPGDDRSACQAAQLLQHYVQAITGAGLCIASERPINNATACTAMPVQVHIGLTADALTDAYSPDPFIGRDSDSFLIAGKRVGSSPYVHNRLYLIGKQYNPLPRSQGVATTYAVSEFLERYLGVHWYLPTRLGEHVPVKSTITVTLSAPVKTYEPSYWGRFISGFKGAGESDLCATDPTYSDVCWANLNKAHGDDWSKRFRFDHNISVHVNEEAIHEGLDVAPYRGRPWKTIGDRILHSGDIVDIDDFQCGTPETAPADWQPYMNPASPLAPPTSDLVANRQYRRIVDADHDALVLETGSAGIMDQAPFDCDDSSKPPVMYSYDERNEFGAIERDLNLPSGEYDFPDRIWSFYNNAAYSFWDQVTQHFGTPLADQYLTAISYGISAPPKDPALKFDEHLVVAYFNEALTTWLDPTIKQDVKEDYVAWALHLEPNGFLGLWERLYGFQFYMPRQSLAILSESLSYYHKGALAELPIPAIRGPLARAYYADGHPTWPMDALSYWFTVRKLWNTSITPTQAIKQYASDMFGALAGAEMALYFTELEEAYTNWPNIPAFQREGFCWTENKSFDNQLHDTLLIGDPSGGAGIQLIEQPYPRHEMQFRQGTDTSRKQKIWDNSSYYLLYEAALPSLANHLTQAKNLILLSPSPIADTQLYLARLFLFQQGFNVFSNMVRLKKLDRMLYEPWDCEEPVTDTCHTTWEVYQCDADIGGSEQCRGWSYCDSEGSNNPNYDPAVLREEVDQVYDILVGNGEAGICQLLIDEQNAINVMFDPNLAPASEAPPSAYIDDLTYLGKSRWDSSEDVYCEDWRRGAVIALGNIRDQADLLKTIYEKDYTPYPAVAALSDPARGADLAQVIQVIDAINGATACVQYHDLTCPAWTPPSY
ncbi:MAG: hypothetical protein C4523_05335 [Myxococcales bacterium]|nr:MAG: hypothetical protein C4523_05335 [Myxococcales bacterium]